MSTRYLLGESAARRLRAMFRDGEDTTPGGGSPFATVAMREAVAPFTVRYSSSYSTSGGWLIYLPTGAWIGADGRGSLTAATDYGDGWYALDISSTEPSSVVAVGNASGSLHVSYARGPLVVATLTQDATTGAKAVTQIVRSAVTRPAAPFEIYAASQAGMSTTLSFAAGWFRTGDAIFRADESSLSVSLTDGGSDGCAVICARIPATESGSQSLPTLVAVSTDSLSSLSADLNYAYMPLYVVSCEYATLGNVVCDLRGIPTSVQFEVAT